MEIGGDGKGGHRPTVARQRWLAGGPTNDSEGGQVFEK